MSYSETVEYLYALQPPFHIIGAAAYKPGFDNILALMQDLGNPHEKLRCVHVAGTNGKGSVSHLLAAVLQSAGYKTGLFTSPHLVDLRERIRVNGEIISEQEVVDFVEKHKPLLESIKPSFFETMTAMAFDCFKKHNVDIAVVEVGLGGRLDSTNIITPVLSVITNIGYDHTEFLGNTLECIAAEKAGIIKKGVPVVVGETIKETQHVFRLKSQNVNSPLIFAEQQPPMPDIPCELQGNYQQKNKQTVYAALNVMREMGLQISDSSIRKGFARVCSITGLCGRWQTVATNPLWICDTGHNSHAFRFVAQQLKNEKYKQLYVIFGMVKDKDVKKVLELLPKDAYYLFTQAQTKRAIKADNLMRMASDCKLQGECVADVATACTVAKQKAETEDMVFVGGSNYVVGEFLQWHKNCNLK